MIDPETLRPHYSWFLRDERILLTGHSHQAWPDVAREGVIEAFEDASALVDDKWAKASEAADAVRRAVASHIGAEPEQIALGQNTHELVTRWLSALDLRGRPHVVTTAGEFHSLHRQLSRLAEEGLEVTWITPQPYETLTARVAAAIGPRTAGVALSTVLFETSAIVPDVEVATEAAREAGAEVLLDTYHAQGVLPFSVPAYAFATGGGYKYLQWGEGACWLRVPAGCALRPVFTGWFSDFANLAKSRDGAVTYGPTGADRFAGSTYDPTSHYRARRVIRFFAAQELTIERLRALSLRQTQRILDGLGDDFTVRTPAARGGFVAVELDDAAAVVAALRERGVLVDARGSLLRLGPAPYTTDDEIDRALAALREVTDR